MAMGRQRATPEPVPSAADPAAGKPLPRPDAVSAPYWQAAAERTLELQHCDRCRRYVHPPEPYCPRCQNESLHFQQVSGEGTVYSYTIVRDNATRGFENLSPYVVALVELTEQPRLILVANIVGVAPDTVHVGMPVRLTWEPIGEGVVLPQFTPA